MRSTARSLPPLVALALVVITTATAPVALAGLPTNCREEAPGRPRTTARSASSGALTAAAAPADPAVVGSWSIPFTLGLSAIHSSLLHTGKVLVFSYPENPADPTRGSEAVLWDPVTGSTRDATLPLHRDLFCAAHSFLGDGRLFTTGGHMVGARNEDDMGIPDTFFFDPATNSWAGGPLMKWARWYPTNVELANGRTLIFSGKVDEVTPVTEVESYDPGTNKISVLPSTANKALPLYPRAVLTPAGKVFFAGPYKGTQYFNPATNSWQWVGNMASGGARNNGNAVILPGLNKVMALGGRNSTTGVTATAEIIDLSVAKPKWRFTGSMTHKRHHANAVLLADGSVLAVGGGEGGAYDAPVKQAELFDPVTETWSVMAPQTADRIYHSTALLLPDGRVLSAGSDGPKNALSQTAEIFSPPYLFKGTRPTIATVPSSVRYGQTFTIATPEAADITRVALVKPGSVTHSTDFSQRYVDLQFTKGLGTLTATSPPNGAKSWPDASPRGRDPSTSPRWSKSRPPRPLA
jgi:hypothetical protein